MLRPKITAQAQADTAKLHSIAEIVGALEHDIIFGALHPRERLVEDELMLRFGSTRHRVRQSIEELVKSGLAVQERHKGARVRDYTPQEVADLYEIRHALQSQAISRLTFPIDLDTISDLKRTNEDHITASKTGNLREVFRLNSAFHGTFFRACGNELLAEAIQTYAWRTHPIRSRGFFDSKYRDMAAQDHRAMIKALIDEDRQTLLELNGIHINRPRDMYLNDGMQNSNIARS